MDKYKILPNKWIRKEMFELLNNIDVTIEFPTETQTFTIPCYDTRVSGVDNPNYYILLTTQSNEVDKNNKCEWFWESEILVDIVTIYPRGGNPGSRLIGDEILEEVRYLTEQFEMPSESGLSVITRTQSFPNDLFLSTDSENIFRNFMRLQLLIK